MSKAPSPPSSPDLDLPDIEELHTAALQRGDKTYIDPEAGFTVFTELLHLQRGTCCGAQCRHCPFGWQNVDESRKKNGRLSSVKVPLQKIASGDKAKANSMVEHILASASSSSNSKETKEKKNVPYTRLGDRGTSQLLTGERRRKDDANFEALGNVDELCAVVGVCHAAIMNHKSSVEFGNLEEQLLDVMSRLFDVGSHVAKPSQSEDGTFNADGIGGGFSAQHIEQLEAWIDNMTEEMPELTSFILPTGDPAAAQLHVGRTVCRRAERSLVELVEEGTCDPFAMQYLNRLSDYLFTAARWVNHCSNQPEIQYQRASISATQRQRKVLSRERTSSSDP